MSITTRTSGDVTVVELPRVFTADHGVDEFRETVRSLLQEGRRRFLVDMNQAYLDDAAMEAVVDAHRTASQHGGTIKLMQLNKGLWGGLLGKTKLLVIFETYDTEAEAVASFGGDKA